MKKNKKVFLALAILLVLVVALFLVWQVGRPAAQAGDKLIVLEVVHKDGSSKEFNISTDAENLRGALEPEGLIAGTESQFGLYVLTVDGETADDTQQEWWCFTRNGEMLPTGVDDTMIADGEHYEASLKIGW